MFDDDPEDDLPEPVFYADGRRAGIPGPSSLPRRFVYVAGPLWDVARSPAEAEAALTVASIAWNATRLPEPERTATLRQLIRKIADGTAQLGSMDDFSEMVLRAMRWPREQRAVVEVGFKELRPGEWHVALLTVTPEDVRRRASSRGARPRGPRRG
jgi:hypothetical protein